MASVATLYTPEVLGLATSLAQYPLDDRLDLHGEARSPTCGSAVVLGLGLDLAGRIARVGIRAHACAIGQAAAAIFAREAIGADRVGLVLAEAAIARWLAGRGALPAWPGLDAIARAADYPARHPAILLSWRAALAALPSA
ncbi:MAG TPA: iron-sulfur cluster assembly scaffold protein [Novosphingobium sp.]|nr:iron-sulfur cluster assembly scaffold protein [Novosphingobium sp.]